MTTIFLDANVFFYAIGNEHRLRNPCRRIIELAESDPKFFTSAEVFQEILHRYVAIRRWDAAKPFVFAQIDIMSGRIEPVHAEDVRLAGNLADRYPSLSARDLVHAAVMLRAGARHIVSADAGFDQITEVERLDPMLVDDWRERVVAG